MKSLAEQITCALRASTRWELNQALRPRRPILALLDIQRLSERLQSFNDPRQPLKIAIVRTYTTELLRPYWTFEALLHGFALDVYEAPYGALLQEVRPGAYLFLHQPDVVYICLQWEDLEPRFGKPLASFSVAERREMVDASLSYLFMLLKSFREAVSGAIVVTLLPRFFGPELGNYEAMVADSETRFRAEVKGRLADWLRESLPSVYFDDLDTLVEKVGRLHLFDFRLWQAARFPFSVAGAQAVVQRLMRYPVLLKHPKLKCIVVDADNTLWGGVVGEEGLTGIALGPDYPGSVFITFQRRLLEFQRRGFLLALCSKNNPEDVIEILTKHPHQLLRQEHFAAMRINWLPKPDNVRAIAEELNVGLESFVFVDDSPHECLSIRQQFPEVTVVQTPERITELPFCLDDLPHLEILSLTQEDQQRTRFYAQERQRRHLMATSNTFDDYLTSLHMVMTIGVGDFRHTARLAQLTQKTNQFNLTTRRYTEADVQRFLSDPDWLVMHFSLADVFGDSGIVGLALVRGLESETAEVDSFLMSCRVIGRQAETAFLYQMLRTLAQRGITGVRARYIPTAKNALVKEFWLQHGFQAIGPDIYQLELTGWAPSTVPPIDIRLYGGENPPQDLKPVARKGSPLSEQSLGTRL